MKDVVPPKSRPSLPPRNNSHQSATVRSHLSLMVMHLTCFNFSSSKDYPKGPIYMAGYHEKWVRLCAVTLVIFSYGLAELQGGRY